MAIEVTTLSPVARSTPRVSRPATIGLIIGPTILDRDVTALFEA
jgi:hypothetical protein